MNARGRLNFVKKNRIINIDNKALNTPEDIKKKNNLIYQALSDSIKNFTDMNLQLKASIEENLVKFREGKKFWLQDMIKTKEIFRNEIQFFLEKLIELNENL